MQYVGLFISFIIFGRVLITACSAFRAGLRQVPGPVLAKITPFWRVWWLWGGNAHEGYRKLHEKYGRIVRTAPDAVEISDPAVIPSIYGINSKFVKVSAQAIGQRAQPIGCLTTFYFSLSFIRLSL